MADPEGGIGEDRLRQLIGDQLHDLHDESLTGRAYRQAEKLLGLFARKLIGELVPNETGPRRRIYAQVLRFRMECPACGGLCWPAGPRRKQYDRQTQKVTCPHCQRVWRIGLLIWPTTHTGPGQQRPPDTIPKLQQVRQLREWVRGTVAGRDKGSNRLVNIFEPGADRSQEE